MKKRLLLLLLITLTALILLGCGGGQVYGKEDTNISVKTGDEFTIKLDENPTTGYQWNYTISDESVLEISKDEYVNGSNAQDVAGAGGERFLTFVAKSKGSTVIDMVYERSWEKNEDDEKISFQVEVK